MERLLFQNLRIYPSDRLRDLYVSDGRIDKMVDAGSRPPDVSSPERTVDVGGAWVYPGFRDAHCHLFSSAEVELALDAADIDSIDRLILAGRQAVSESGLYIKRLNDMQLSEQRMPSVGDLDRISDSLPVIAMRICGHVASVNSVVLEAGPELKQRCPDGLVLENDIDLLPSLRDIYGQNEMKEAVRTTIRRMLSYGLTAISSNDFGRFESAGMELMLQEILDEFPGFAYRSQYAVPLPFDPYSLLRLAAKSGVRPAVKLFRDGSLGGRTAWLSKPYSDAPDTCGQDTLDDETHEAVINTANRLGLQVLTHAIGDQAIGRTLDLLEKTSDPENPLRHALVHAQMTNDSLLQRMQKQNVLAIVQPLFTESDRDLAPARLGPRCEDAYRFKAMAECGVRLAFSSDAPVESSNPLQTIRAAMRGKPTERESGFSFDEALQLHTEGAAFADFAEDRCGRLEEGMAADFVVFEKNLGTLLPDELAGQHCLMTVAGGHAYSFSEQFETGIIA